MTNTIKTPEERVQELSMELLSIRKELKCSEQKILHLEQENQRLTKENRNNDIKIPFNEFYSAINKIDERYKVALEEKKLNQNVKLPPKLSISSVADEMNIDDSTIHHGYKEVKELINIKISKSQQEKVDKFQTELNISKQKLQEMRVERDQRYELCQKLACNLYRKFIISNSNAYLPELSKGVRLEIINGGKPKK